MSSSRSRSNTPFRSGDNSRSNSARRILQVCSAREAVYGAVVSLMTLAEHQRAAENEVEFCTFEGMPFGNQVRARGFRAHEVSHRYKVDFRAVGKMMRIIREGAFDVVHTHLSTSSLNGGLAARLVRLPVVSTVHGMSGKLSFMFADHLIGVSQQVKTHLIRQGVAPEKVSVVYNGIDLAAWTLDADAAREKLGLTAAGPVLGTVSRITAAKGIDDAIRVVAALLPEFPKLRYLLVGDGDAVESCRALARELGVLDAIQFAGYQADVRPYLAAMDLFLFPSRKEAMGIALVEAMSAGLATVATRVDGIPEVITADVGLLCAERDVTGFTQACRELLDDSTRRVAFGANARLRAENVFSARAMERATADVYQKLIEGRPRRSGDPSGERDFSRKREVS